MNYCTIDFVVYNPNPFKTYYITGENSQFGNWDPEEAIPTYKDSSRNSSYVYPDSIFYCSRGSNLVFKIFHKVEGQKVWESVPGNREYKVEYA